MPQPEVSLNAPSKPQPALSLLDCTSIIVGIIIGSAIYKIAPLVVHGAGGWAVAEAGRCSAFWGASPPSESLLTLLVVVAVLGVWIVGGLVALIGAMCYAELAKLYPGTGSSYYFAEQSFLNHDKAWRYARLSNGDLLAKGRTVTGFANVEEDFADNAVWEMGALSRDKHVMPWRIEDELKKIGANYIQAGMWRAFAVRDGNLITGQQNFSGAETARRVIEALGQ